ncbi:receptor-interacting serine/threonine-protein kinase 2 isoform X2 [Engystomops pustulosus]
MPNGSLNQLLHEDNPFPEISWPLRIRILYEIALGVNFLHNMSPPLLHHDLKTPNILLDSEFHAKIADFGLSKWRMLSQSLSDHNPPGGTIIYMPPELYDPEKNSRGSVKHDMYSYAIIMWEVLSRKQPYEGATNPMQIMFSVAKGNRPDTSEESLPSDIPHRDLFVSIMQSGWASDPNDRPAFLKCLLELEPVIRKYDDISMLEGILEIKKARNNITCISTPSQPMQESISPLVPAPSTIPASCPGYPSIVSLPPYSPHDIESVSWEQSEECKVAKEIGCTHSYIYPEQESSSTTLMWVQRKRDQIVKQMTDACLNQCLDALISNLMILQEDYELIRSQCTRSERVRKLIDTCELIGEHFARIIVQKLKDNRQNGLQPFP